MHSSVCDLMCLGDLKNFYLLSKEDYASEPCNLWAMSSKSHSTCRLYSILGDCTVYVEVNIKILLILIYSF